MTPKTKYLHRCNLPDLRDSLPDNAAQMKVKWKCSFCKQRWIIEVVFALQNATRVGKKYIAKV